MPTEIFTTADPHFLHENIVELSHRPFANYAQMEEMLISNWNRVVHPGDVVICVGDFALTWKKTDGDKVDKLLAQLHGTKLLVIGNHDRDPVTKNPRWAKVTHYHELKVDLGGSHAQRVCFSHYPLRSWNQMHRGSWMIHGHCHNNLPDPGGLIADTGVDARNFTPWNLRAEIQPFMAARQMLVSGDHHD